MSRWSSMRSERCADLLRVIGQPSTHPAGEGAGPQPPSDYVLVPSRHEREGGIFRANVRTGEMSICYVFDDKVVCTPQAK